MNALYALAVLLMLAPDLARATERPGCLYEVEVSLEVALEVAVTCDPGVTGLERVDGFSGDFARLLESSRSDRRFAARYRTDLAALARRHRTLDAATVSGESVLAVGASWLMRPRRTHGERGTLDVRVTTPPGVEFVTAQPLREGMFSIPEAELAQAGYSAFGRFERHAVPRYEVVILDGPRAAPSLPEWIARIADIMGDFWHGFPAPGLKIFVLPRPGAEGVLFGRDMSGGGLSMVLVVGEHTTRAQLDDDWVLVHEMVHLGSPFVRGAPWFTEGLATYLEPLIRARYGLQPARAMWKEFVEFMPRGAAVIGDTGLARGGFRGWYWGGAVLMLLADVEMRRASGGRIGLEDCLRAIRAELGNYLRSVGLEAMVAACDAAVGGETLARLVERHAAGAAPVDLDRLWRDLGVRRVGDRIELDDAAPWAALREAIVRGGPTD